MRMPLCLIALITLFAATSESSARTWTDLKGNTLEGDVVSLTQTHVGLKVNESKREYPIRIFSKEDQRYLKKLLEERRAEDLAARLQRSESAEEALREDADRVIAEERAAAQAREEERQLREQERANERAREEKEADAEDRRRRQRERQLQRILK